MYYLTYGVEKYVQKHSMANHFTGKTGNIIEFSASKLVRNKHWFHSANMRDVIISFYYLLLELYFPLHLLQIQLYKASSGLP